MTLPFHPLANLFPLIEGKEFEDLVADVDRNRLQERIVMLDGMILDGRNRYRAALEADEIGAPDGDEVDPAQWPDHFVQFDRATQGDPLTWVLSKNLHRRHLNETQRATVAAKLETMTHGGRRTPAGGQDADVQLDRKTAADMLNVSVRLTASAKKVLEKGAPELIARMEQGDVKASVAEQLANLTKAKQREIIDSVPAGRLKTVAKQVRRQDTEQRLATRQRALPTKLYGVIYGDPAWRFEPYSRATGMDRAADNHYPTQDLAEVKALPVGTLAARDCVLFLWATSPMLPQALEVMRYWGFNYVSHLVWRKAEAVSGKHQHGGLVLGTGYWFRSGHELLLVGTRGDVPAPAMGTQTPSILDAPPRRHSQKPDEAYALIERYFPNLPRIELNARIARDGWDRWGNEAPPDAPASASTPTPDDPGLSSGPADARSSGGADSVQDKADADTQAPVPFRSTPETDAIIRDGYAADVVDFPELSVRLGGATKLQIRRRASQLGLGNRDRQLAAVSGPRISA